tara:strand:- start:113 stop:427 length:315 start_codon:yes stop_codon:yes gene_type:complete
MAVTWNVSSLDATKTVGSLSDVVTTVHWIATETDGEHTGYRYGSIALAEAKSSSFTAYKDITKDNAVSWAKAAIGSDEVTAIETSIALQISESKSPTVSSGVPW